MGFKEEMEQHDGTWEQDQANAGMRGRLPDGDYPNAVITESRIDHDEKDDTYQWIQKWEADYLDSEGNERHGSVRKWYNLDHEVGRAIAAEDSKRLGFTGKLSELEGACESEAFIGMVCRIKVETKPGSNDRDFTNVYLNDVMGQGDVPVPTPANSAQADDDIPF